MTRTLTITAAEWASAKDGTLWLVRDADICTVCFGCRLNPSGFSTATGPLHVPCPDCRIELVGCADCVAWPTIGCPTFHTGTVTLGYAYTSGQPEQQPDGKWAIELDVQP